MFSKIIKIPNNLGLLAKIKTNLTQSIFLIKLTNQYAVYFLTSYYCNFHNTYGAWPEYRVEKAWVKLIDLLKNQKIDLKNFSHQIFFNTIHAYELRLGQDYYESIVLQPGQRISSINTFVLDSRMKPYITWVSDEITKIDLLGLADIR